MNYEPRWERFEVTGPDGQRRRAEFVRAGILTMGDRPELFFFRVGGEEVAIGVSGDALRRFEAVHRCLSREEKIDVTGLLLKAQIEAGLPLDSRNLFVRDEELARLTGELHIPA